MFKSKIRATDFKAIFLFGICYIPAILIKAINKKNFLFSERPHEARDNGFALFKYNFNVKGLKKRYVITKDSVDINKFSKNDKVIYFGSLKHYFYYLASYIHLSAHVDLDSPNSRVSNFLETHHLLKNKRVFLQHGITKDKISFGYYNVSRADLFTCGAIPEYEFVKKEFGYPNGNVKLTGFARFDSLISNPRNQILIMPTWRSWMVNYTEDEFKRTPFFEHYFSLINNDILLNYFKRSQNIILYLHSDMQKFSHLFNSSFVKIAKSSEYDVQQLLIESNLLITDYSSVAFDFAYMKKPIIYYHFDYDDYREHQHPAGYFEYKRDAFGPLVYNEEELLNEIIKFEKNGFVLASKYKENVNKFYCFFDKENCQRIYQEVIKLL